MSAKNKNKKHAQQEDLLQVEMSLIEKYKKPFIFGCVLVVLAVIGWNIYSSAKEDARQEAVQNRSMSETAFMFGNLESALKGDSLSFYKPFEQLASEGDNVSVAYAGICLAQMGEWEQAVAILEKFEPQDDTTISPRVLSVLANAYANVGNSEKAIETFKKAAKGADSNVAANCLKQAANIHLALGQKAEARALYEQIKAEYIETQAAADIEKKLLQVAE